MWAGPQLLPSLLRVQLISLVLLKGCWTPLIPVYVCPFRRGNMLLLSMLCYVVLALLGHSSVDCRSQAFSPASGTSLENLVNIMTLQDFTSLSIFRTWDVAAGVLYKVKLRLNMQCNIFWASWLHVMDYLMFLPLQCLYTLMVQEMFYFNTER